MTPELNEKYERLRTILRDMKSVLVAFSGGADSTLLLRVARDVLGDRVLAVTATSATLGDDETACAQRVAAEIGAPHLLVETDELTSPEFVHNPPDRCYHCKKLRYGGLRDLRVERGLDWVADGVNADDAGDWRPGMRAAEELGIRSPLREAGFGKSDVRELSAILGLSTAEKPSAACLASRIPYGETITENKLRQVEEAERFLRDLGFGQLRVRYHGDVARIEVPEQDMQHVIEHAAEIVAAFARVGFNFVSLDLAGFKSGSMNKALGR